MSERMDTIATRPAEPRLQFNPDDRENWPDRNPDVQEALSRKYSDDVIMLLPLKNGTLAVWNSARELCGFVHRSVNGPFWNEIERVWHPPKPVTPQAKPPVDLDDLELL